MEQTLFYILAVVTVLATIFAITARQAVHAIVYLVTSFFALAAIFFLLGAPMVAVFEVIIYAGAIMVLFLFVIMMLDLAQPERAGRLRGRDWWPALLLVGVTLTASLILLGGQPLSGQGLPMAVGVREFGIALFRTHGLAVEIISLQLLFALVGALYLGRKREDE